MPELEKRIQTYLAELGYSLRKTSASAGNSRPGRPTEAQEQSMEQFPVVRAPLDEFESKPDGRNLPADSHHNSDRFLTHGNSHAAQGAGLQALGTAHQQASLAEVNQLAREAASRTRESDRHAMRGPKAFCSSSRHSQQPSLIILIQRI